MLFPGFSSGDRTAKIRTIGIFLAVVLVSSVLAYSAGSSFAVSPSNVATYNKWTTVNDYDYLIFNDGTTTYAKNGDTGAIDYSGTNSTTVIRSAITQLTAGETLLIKGDYNIGNTVLIDREINFIHYGKTTLTGSAPYINYQTSTTSKKSYIYIQEIDGQDKSRDCIKVTGGIATGSISFGSLRYCNHAIYLASGGASYNDLQIYGDIENNNYGIFFDTPTGSETAREGIAFHGSMFSNLHGVYISSGNHFAGSFSVGPDSVIDNAATPNSWDFEDYSTNNLPHVIDPKFIRGERVISQTFMKIDVNNVVRNSIDNILDYRITADTGSSTTGGGGSVSRNLMTATLTTGAIANDGIQLQAPTDFLPNAAMYMYEHIAAGSSSNIVIRTGLVVNPNSFINSDIIEGIQVKYNGTNWFIEVADGATRTEVNTGEPSTDVQIAIQYIPSSGGATVWIRGNNLIGYYVNTTVPDDVLAWFTNVKTTTAATKSVSIQQAPEIKFLS